MQIRNLSKRFVLGIMILSFTLGSCKKCLTCTGYCLQVYAYDTLSRKYDTLCSQNFSSWQVFLDTVNFARGGYVQQISTNTFSSCRAQSSEVQRARCY